MRRVILAGVRGDLMGNDGLFTSVNDSIRQLAAADDPATEIWEFFCECPDVDCHTLVSLTVGEFDERRASSPPVPVLAEEHAGFDR